MPCSRRSKAVVASLAKAPQRNLDPMPHWKNRIALPVSKGIDVAANETGLVTLGCGIALLSAAFGAYSVLTSADAPQISGNEHLLIFARPAGFAKEMATPATTSATTAASPIATTPIAATPIAATPIEADPIVTGSIGTPKTTMPVRTTTREERTVVRYRLHGIFHGKALLQGADGFIMAGIGSSLPEAGLIMAVEARKEGWVVVTSGGIITASLR